MSEPTEVNQEGRVTPDFSKTATQADRKPVQAARSQDANPDSNDDKTIITEGGQPAAPPNSKT